MAEIYLSNLFEDFTCFEKKFCAEMETLTKAFLVEQEKAQYRFRLSLKADRYTSTSVLKIDKSTKMELKALGVMFIGELDVISQNRDLELPLNESLIINMIKAEGQLNGASVPTLMSSCQLPITMSAEDKAVISNEDKAKFIESINDPKKNMKFDDICYSPLTLSSAAYADIDQALAKREKELGVEA